MSWKEKEKIKSMLAKQKDKEPCEIDLSLEPLFIQVRFYDYGTEYILRFPRLPDNLAVGHLDAYYDDYHDNDAYSGKMFKWLCTASLTIIVLEPYKPGFSRSLYTNSATSFDQISAWIRECSLHHKHCHPARIPTEKNQGSARFLAVGETNSPDINLCPTSTLDLTTTTYMTLSHCWGKLVPHRLLQENVSQFLGGIRMSNLPKTFRKVVEATRRLGIEFIWIDSLCIVQDSKEDWTIESRKMHQIYKNSFLNLAAAVSEDANGGLFYARFPLSITPCAIEQGTKTKRRAETQYHNEIGYNEIKKVPLLNRGWVLQEWLLAPRTLICGKQELHWKCEQVLAHEALPDGQEARPEIDWGFTLRTLPQSETESNSIRWDLWNTVVVEYSKKKLTKFPDKLVAVAGLSSDMGENWHGVRCLAGHWPYRFLRNGPCHNECNAPTWSWASVDSEIFRPHREQLSDSLLFVIHTETQPFTPSPLHTGVENCSIQVWGPMLWTTISRISNISVPFLYHKWNIHLFATDSSQYDGETFPDNTRHGFQPTIQGDIHLDRLEHLIDVATVCLVPFEVHLSSDSCLTLEGLILEPTNRVRGEYKRLGHFEIKDD